MEGLPSNTITVVRRGAFSHPAIDMTSAFPSSRAWFACITVAVATAIALSLPSNASASCGDWLAGHNTSTVTEDDVDSHLADNLLLPAPARESTPCRGLRCDGLPNLPVDAPPTTIVSGHTEHWCCLNNCFAPLHAAAIFFMPADELRPPAAIHSPLEHPPRSVI